MELVLPFQYAMQADWDCATIKGMLGVNKMLRMISQLVVLCGIAFSAPPMQFWYINESILIIQTGIYISSLTYKNTCEVGLEVGFCRWIDHMTMFSPVRKFQKKNNRLLYMSLRGCRLELINISNSVRIFFKTNRLYSFIISGQSDWNWQILAQML